MSIGGKRVLKIIGWIIGSIALLLLLLVLFVFFRWDARDGRPTSQMRAPSDSAAIAHGEYIYKFQAQCWGCHSTDAGGASGLPTGGMKFDLTKTGPGFGIWYSRNLTPDSGTGIGSWTDGEIVQALREGLNRDHLTLFPIMPVDWYHGMADEDVLSVVAYLRSLPAVKNAVPAREPSFVAKALFTFRQIKPEDPISVPIAAPPRGITAEYGKYVSNHLAGCADCHTPRNLQNGQFYLDSLFAGSSFAFGDAENAPLRSYARNITPDKETGIGSWTEEQFINAVTMGMRPDSTVLTPYMPYAYYKSWALDDLKAVFTYLKTLPALRRNIPPTVVGEALKTAQGTEHGRLLFATRCQGCHGKNAGGAQPTNVRLAEVSASLDDSTLKEFIAAGQMNVHMPAFGKTLNEGELKDLVAFIRTCENK